MHCHIVEKSGGFWKPSFMNTPHRKNFQNTFDSALSPQKPETSSKKLKRIFM
jgi:hypothetical protein